MRAGNAYLFVSRWSSSVTEWYLDIETEGTDPQADRILTIQYQPLREGRPAGTLQVLAEWEWGEKQIVRSIIERGLLDPTGDFVPVGKRLSFAITFIIQKAEKYGVRKFTEEELRHYWLRKPIVDLAPLLLLMNRGVRPSSVSGLTYKENSPVPKLYREGRYADIIAYVTREKDDTLAMLTEAGPPLKDFGSSRSSPATPPRA